MFSGARRARWGWVAIGAVLVLAAANFLWQLGASSLYVDEIEARAVAIQWFADLVHALRTIEVTPPGYFVFLHEWVGHAGALNSDTLLRLPSAAWGPSTVGRMCGRRSTSGGPDPHPAGPGWAPSSRFAT